MSIALLSELLLKNDDSFTWLSLTNNEIGVPIPELTEALRQNRTLRKVSCHAGFLGSLVVEDLALLMETLSSLSHLQDLWLALPARQASRSSTVLRTILGSPQMMSGLQKLTLRGMDDAGCQVLSRALAQPGSRLTDLQIRGTTCSSTSTNANGTVTSSKATSRGILAIAEMLQVNRSLERMDLCYKGLDDESCEAMARALAVNQKLQKLDLSSPSTSSTPINNGNNNNQQAPQNKKSLAKGYHALSQTMRQNYTLHHLNTAAEGDSKSIIDLFTKLNRTGARALMRNTTYHTGLEDVLEVLQDNNKDVTTLYEILALNPALWDPAQSNATGLAPSFVTEAPAKLKKIFAPTKNTAVSQHCPATTTSVAPAKKKKLKPVMARWNEDMISQQEREKIKNFKRWTPTIIDIPIREVRPRPRTTPEPAASADVGPSVVPATVTPIANTAGQMESLPAPKEIDESGTVVVLSHNNSAIAVAPSSLSSGDRYLKPKAKRDATSPSLEAINIARDTRKRTHDSDNRKADSNGQLADSNEDVFDLKAPSSYKSEAKNSFFDLPDVSSTTAPRDVAKSLSCPGLEPNVEVRVFHSDSNLRSGAPLVSSPQEIKDCTPSSTNACSQGCAVLTSTDAVKGPGPNNANESFMKNTSLAKKKQIVSSKESSAMNERATPQNSNPDDGEKRKMVDKKKSRLSVCTPGVHSKDSSACSFEALADEDVAEFVIKSPREGALLKDKSTHQPVKETAASDLSRSESARDPPDVVPPKHRSGQEASGNDETKKDAVENEATLAASPSRAVGTAVAVTGAVAGAALAGSLWLCSFVIDN